MLEAYKMYVAKNESAPELINATWFYMGEKEFTSIITDEIVKEHVFETANGDVRRRVTGNPGLWFNVVTDAEAGTSQAF